MHTEHGCAITGWASALPSTIVTNQDIMTLFDTTDEWIVERTGIRKRRAADGPFVIDKPTGSPVNGMGTTATLAAEAGKGALEMAGLSGADVDLLILCTTTADQMVPATSSPLANALCIKGGGMDINAACRGLHLRPGYGGRLHRHGRRARAPNRFGDPDPDHQLGGPLQCFPFRGRRWCRRHRSGPRRTSLARLGYRGGRFSTTSFLLRPRRPRYENEGPRGFS